MAPSGITILTPDSGEDRTPPWEVNLPRAVATTCVSSSRDSKSLKETQKTNWVDLLITDKGRNLTRRQELKTASFPEKVAGFRLPNQKVIAEIRQTTQRNFFTPIFLEISPLLGVRGRREGEVTSFANITCQHFRPPLQFWSKKQERSTIV